MKPFAPLLLALALVAPVGAQVVTQTAQPRVGIPDDGYIGLLDENDGTGEDAGMACAELDFSGDPDTAVHAGLMRIGITHTWLGDLTVKVQSPNGTVLPVLARPLGDLTSDEVTGDDGTDCCGDSSDLSGDSPLTLLDGGREDAESLGFGLLTDGVVCSDDGLCEYAPNPSTAAGGPGYIGTFAEFAGESSVGVWTVCVGDGAAPDAGTFDFVELSLSSNVVALGEDASSAFAFGFLGPNPFSGSTTLGLRTTSTQSVRATLHDMLGREVAVLFEGAAVAGVELRIGVAVRALPGGTYVARLSGETFTATQSLTIVR